MRAGGRARAAAALAALTAAAPLAAGCYAYAPVGRSAVTAGEPVRVALAEPAEAGLAGRVGDGVTAVEGRVRAQDARGVELAVTATVRRDGTVQPWSGEAVALTWPEVREVQTRRLSAGRSGLLAASLVGGAMVAAVGFGTDFVLGGRSRGGSSPER